MQNLINQKTILENTWNLISDAEQASPALNGIVPAYYWLENKAAFSDLKQTAIWLDSSADLADFKDQLDDVDLIAINFPAFADGRGYSLARLIKERTNFKGELRAVGDVLLDQLYFMKRCGFDTYLLKEGLSADQALAHFSTFAAPYQLAYDEPAPLFRR